jgi:Na+/H+-translocating membrane pyrophosphatase
MQLVYETVSIGVLVVVIGHFVMKAVTNSSMVEDKMKPVVSLFITGALVHLICEFSGVNRWYCENGNACK